MPNSTDQRAHERIDMLEREASRGIINVEKMVREATQISGANAVAIREIKDSVQKIENVLYVGNGKASLFTELALIKAKLDIMDSENKSRKIDRKTMIAIGLGVIGFFFQAMKVVGQIVATIMEHGGK